MRHDHIIECIYRKHTREQKIGLPQVITYSSQVTVDVVKPVKQGYEAALLLTPANKVSGKVYRPLAKTLQQYSPLSLWVALLDDFKDGTVTVNQMDEAVATATKSLKTAGMKTNCLFIAGHGTGGVPVAQFIQRNFSQFQAMLLYATHIPDSLTLRDYLVSTLTMSGDLDGVTRMTRMLHMYHQYSSHDLSDYRTPYVVLPGVNHAQFASGPMPDYIRVDDIRSDIDNTTALRLIANYTAAFLSATIYQPANFIHTAVNTMKYALNMTRTIIEPLIKTQALDRDDTNGCGWAALAQSTLVGLTYAQFFCYSVITDLTTLAMNPPGASYFNENFYIDSYSTLTMPKSDDKILDIQQSAVEIQTKMVDQKTAKSLFPNGTYKVVNASCQMLNKLSYKYAMDLSSAAAKTRLQKRGVHMIFLDDIHINEELLWLAAKLKTEVKNGSLYVTSARYTVETSSKLVKHLGIIGCNLISPFRAIEWIYIDSLKQRSIYK